jgi:hypothetical protein
MAVCGEIRGVVDYAGFQGFHSPEDPPGPETHSELGERESMETILNLVWLGVTLAALWLWRFRWAASRRNPRHNIQQESIAIVCLLALLFPVISLSDDLHPEIAVVDSASGKRQCMVAAIGTHNSHAGKVSRTHSSMALLPRIVGQLEFGLEGIVSHVLVHSVSISADLQAGRSPPSLL